MAGFIRRYSYFPGTEVLTLIEGVIIVDLPPPGAISGVGTGTVACVGEFVDCTYGVAVVNGAVSTQPVPTEVFSAQDMLNKVGGFDPTIGDFGVSDGNGFVALRSKQFARLILVPTNMASAHGARMVRQLPTCKSATDPSPALPMQAARVPAGTEFRASGNRVRTAAAQAFTGGLDYARGVDGTVTASGLPLSSENFQSTSANFLNPAAPVAVGDILVAGSIGGAGAIGTDASTYRVIAVVDANNLTIQRIDGTQFTSGNWAASAALPYRLHKATDADTGTGAWSAAAQYDVASRPLDATIAAATLLAPTVAAAAPTATSWDPLAGLTMGTDPSAGLVFTSAVQAPNAASASGIDTLYLAAIDALLPDDQPERDVNIVFSARTSLNIRNKLKSHVDVQSQSGIGRMALLSPEINVVNISTVLGDSDPGVGANRDERVAYTWPGGRIFVPEAVGYTLKCADGILTGADVQHPDGQLDIRMDSFLASVLSVLPPENNPGQGGEPVPTAMGAVLGLQRGLPAKLQITDYEQLRARGVCALRIDRVVGPIFQSGVTTSLVSGQKNINRRRFADFVEDSLAQAFAPMSKMPLNQALKDALIGEADAFLNAMLSPDNPPASRITAYLIDDESGNTKEFAALGIWVLIVKVQMTPTADFIVLQAQVSNESISVKQAA